MTEVDPRIEMEVTVTFRYKTDPSNYDSPEPDMVAIQDTEIFTDDYNLLTEVMDSAEEDTMKIEVKPA